MPATREQARDQVIEAVRTAALAAGVDPSSIIYDDKAGEKPATDTPRQTWIRLSFRHTGSIKSSLSGDMARARFTRTGFLMVQVFTPRGDGLVEADRSIPIIRASIEGKTTVGGVQFFEVNAAEIGHEGGWFLTNITARVEYDEFVTT